MKKLTSEQQDFVNSITQDSDKYLALNALPGTGKTFTIIEGVVKKIRSFSKTDSILCCAYNKAIETTLTEKLIENNLTSNIYCSTIHALGFSIIRNHLKKQPFELTEFKNTPFIMEYFKNKGIQSEVMNFLPFFLMDKIFTLMKENLVSNSFKIASQYNLFLDSETDYDFDIYSYLDECFTDMNKKAFKIVKGKYYNGRKLIDGPHIKIDFTDMVFLPSVKDINSETNVFDWIIIDEAQDLSPAKIKLLEKCLSNKGKLIFIGDRNQCINQYCGASTHIFDNICDNNQSFNLTFTMRCSKQVVNKVNEDFPHISFHAFHSNKEGAFSNIDILTCIEQIKQTNPKETIFIMNSENSPLFKTYLLLIKSGFNVTLKGNEVKEYLFALLKQSNTLTDLKINVRKRLGGAFKTVKRFFPEMSVSDIEKQDTYKLHKEPITILYDLVNHFFKIDLSNDIESIKDLISIEQIKQKISQIYKQTDSNITLLTCHKSKGLEASIVFITDFNQLYEAKENTDLTQFNNVRFVALTRAVNELHFVEQFDYQKTSQILLNQTVDASI